MWITMRLFPVTSFRDAHKGSAQLPGGQNQTNNTSHSRITLYGTKCASVRNYFLGQPESGHCTQINKFYISVILLSLSPNRLDPPFVHERLPPCATSESMQGMRGSVTSGSTVESHQKKAGMWVLGGYWLIMTVKPRCFSRLLFYFGFNAMSVSTD